MKSKIVVENVKCHGCANTIQSQLGRIDGVSEVLVNVPEKTISVTYDGDIDRTHELEEKLKSLGYPPEGKNNTGMVVKSFLSCAIGKTKKKN